MMIQTVTGNLLDAKEQYLCHQCNCITHKAAHLAASVFRRFPYSDVYSSRREDSEPGTILIKGDGEKQRLVVAMFAQVYPSVPRFPSDGRDGYAARQGYFVQCLGKLGAVKGIREAAFPHMIGCGAAGGHWPTYLNLIQEFASKTGIKVIMYKLPD